MASGVSTIAAYGVPSRARPPKQPKNIPHVTRKGETVMVTARQKAAYEAAEGRRPPPLDSTPSGAHWKAVMENARGEHDAYKINELGYIPYTTKKGKKAWSKPKYGAGSRAMTTSQALQAAMSAPLPL